MQKGLILAAAMSALAFGFAGTASAGVAGHNLGGFHAPGNGFVQTVHWTRHGHQHRHCKWRWGHRQCWWG